MALLLNQIACNGSSAVIACELSPGQTAIFNSVTASGTVYLGLSASVTSSNGYPVVTGQPQTVISLPVMAVGVTIYALGSGSVALGVAVSGPS